MIPRGLAEIFGKDVFHDTVLNKDVMYMGDWWSTSFFVNLSIRELLGDKMGEPRCQMLLEILQVEPTWRINAISDGQRRRCQLLEALVTEKSVYILDEITTDLDLYAREALLNFLRTETEQRGATILYATHIFDCLADWATHIVFFAHGEIQRCCPMSELKEYHELVAAKDRVPLYTLMKQWVFQQYPDAAEPAGDTGPVCPHFEGPMIEMKNMSFSYAQGLPPVLKDMTLAIERGSRCLVVGANGACKSTVMSILGGKRMIPRGFAKILGKDCFNDPSIARDVMYCGDWWNTQFFMNTTIADLLGENGIDTDRCRHL